MAMDNPSYFIMPEEASAVGDGYNPFNSHSANARLSSQDCVDFASSRLAATSQERPTETSTSHHDDVFEESCESKRSFRSLLRSMSANSSSSKRNQGILQGLPRPTDIAPPGPVPAFRCSASKINDASKRRNRPSQFHNIHDGKFTKHSVVNQSADIFYTMPLTGNGKRRHSIGTYLNGDAMGSKNVLKITSVPSEVPTMDPPVFFQDSLLRTRRVFIDGPSRSHQTVTTLLRQETPLPKATTPIHTPSNTSRRKRSRRISTKEMEDIVIIYSCKSTEGQLWSDYLSSCFDKMMSQRARQHYRVVQCTIEEITNDDEHSIKTRGIFSNAKLQVIVLCPKLLESFSRIFKDFNNLFSSIFKSSKVLAMLLGVSTESLKREAETTSLSFEEWQKMEISEQNSSALEGFLSAAVSILSRKNMAKVAGDKAAFSIVPKKIKMGQNRVIALLNEQIESEDVMTVSVDKKGEVLQITSFKKRNPYTLQFDIPDCCLEVSMLIWINIEKNGISLGSRQIKCESRLRELDQILRASDNPLEFMCQTLGFKTSDREQLDNWMLSSFQKNIPPHFNLLCSPQIDSKHNSPSMDEYPTLLHFAARFGLEKLCWQLLECPGGDAASDIRNVRHLTPADLAHSAGFSELAVVLRGYMQMNEFSNMYYYLKNISEDDPQQSKEHHKNETLPSKDASAEEGARHESLEAKPSETPLTSGSDPFSDMCLQNLEPQKAIPELSVILPPAKPFNDQIYENDSVLNNITKMYPNTIQKALENDYLIQPSNIKVEPIKHHAIATNPYTCTPMNFSHQPVFLYSPTEEVKAFTPTETIPMRQHKEKMLFNLSNARSSQTNTTLSGQDELAEIINDFKNNVFTINEVEKLVVDWRNRNETTQSLKEKQEQLDRMRREYERLQKKMKEDLKRPTPFERVKKLFSKGKSKTVRKAGSVERPSSTLRPTSQLSVQSESSSSSGRLSTVSGASLGESGVQSDPEDKKAAEKLISSMSFADIKTTNANDDYLIPPPPRPLGFGGIGLDFYQQNQLNQPLRIDALTDRDSQHVVEKINPQNIEFPKLSESNKNSSAHLYMNIAPQ